jgi:tetratricopeptide (TPR) repeat protein
LVLAYSNSENQILKNAIHLFQKTTKYDEAHEELLKCFQENPDNPDILFWLAKSYFHNYADSAQTVKLLRRALQINPLKTECKSLLIGAMQDEGYPVQERLRLAKEAVAEQPDWIIPRETLSIIYDELGDYERSDKEIHEVLKLMKKLRASGKYKEYSYFEGCVTGRHLHDNSERDLLSRLVFLRNVRRPDNAPRLKVPLSGQFEDEEIHEQSEELKSVVMKYENEKVLIQKYLNAILMETMTSELAANWAEGLRHDLLMQGPEKKIPVDVAECVQKLIEKLQESILEVPMARIKVLACAGALLKTVEMHFPFNSPYWNILVQLGVKLGEEMKKEGLTESDIVG